MHRLSELIEDTGYELLCGDISCEIKDIIYDSRKAAPDTVFVCMKGSRIDPHSFIPEVYEKGCRAFVISEPSLVPEELKDSGAAFVLCRDTRRALSLMSQVFFDHPAERLRLIGLTGTKGKTTTAYMIKSILEHAGHRTGIIGTVGCGIGEETFPTANTTPESYELQRFLSMMVEAGCSHAVMECSSQGFKMGRLHGLRFDAGAFLNISPDHIGPTEHADFEEYLSCKAELAPASEHFYYNAFADHIDELFSIAGMDPKSQSVSSFGLLPEGWDRELPDVYGFGQRLVEDGAFAGTEFSFRAPGVERSLRLSMPGDHNVENALCAAAVCLGLGVHIDTIAEALSLVRVNGRMENVYAGHGFRVLIDYAHNEESMESLLRLLRGFRPGRLVVVFGCGGDRSRERRTGMGHVAAHMADLTVMTSDNPRTEPPEAIIDDIEQAYREAGGSPDACVRISDRREAIAWAMKNARSGDLIAVIGKGHEEYQEINGRRTHFSDREEIERIGREIDG